MIRKLLLSFLFFLLSLFTFGKNTSTLNINTIRANYFSDKISIIASTITSTSTGGNWSDASSWVGGVVPTATDDVVIASAATITSAGTINAKTLTINGNLIVSNTVTLNSVTQVTINGLLSFADNNSNIHLPSGTAVKINSPGKVDKSKCSNNVAIYIGSTKIAACTGNGGGTVYDFDAFNSGGGTMNAIANSNSPVCQNGTINLIGSYSGSAGTKTSGGSAGVNYSWSMKAPDGTTTTSNAQNYNLTASQTGNYTAILTCTTYYGGDLYTSTSTITVAVNQAFSLTSVTAVKCTSSTTPVVTLNSTASGLPIGTYTVTYNTTNPSSTAKTATMTVNTAGSGAFTTTDLTTVNSSTITITNLASGSSGNSCSNTISGGNTATLQTPPSPQSGYLAYVAPACFNSPITINLTGTIVGAVVRWEKRLSPSTTWTTIANTTNSYTETPATAGTWEYRVMVGDVNCGTVYTGVLQVEIRPELTVTLNSTNSPVCKDGVSSTLTYSATTGSPNGYALVFDSAAKSAGFGDQGGSFTAGAGTITINVPYGVAVGTYNATVRVFIYSTSCTSVTYPVTVTVSAQISSVSIAPTTTQNFCTTGNLLTVTESGGTITSRQWGKRSVSGGTITSISGATSTTYTPTTASLGVGTWYVVCTSTNGGCTVTSNEVIVNAGNIVSAASSTPTTCIGVNMTSITHTTINASGINSSSITGLPAGVTASWNNNTITISGTPTATGTFTYSIPLTGCSNAVNATGTITVNSAPAITTQPVAPAAVCSGNGTRTLTVTATGTNLTYVWKKDGTAVTNGGVISGATTASLTLTNPTTANQGNYTVDISGSCTPTVTSTAVTVAVNTAPSITTQPTAPAATCSGTGTRTITVVASGTNLAYVWKKDGTALTNGGVISGATSATLTLTNPTTANQGSYTVDISGTCTPAVTSNPVAVTINTAPSITTQPTAPAATCAGSGTQTITVVASGTNLAYVWKKDGTALTNGGVISGATSASLTLTNPTTANQGNYTVDISGTCTPAVTSTPVAVTINTAPSITTHPATPAATCSGSGTQSMTVVATGTGLTYQWRKDLTPITNGGTISGATSATLTLTNPTTSDAGSYDVVVTGTCASAVTSTARTVTVYTPTITNAAQAKTCANRHVTYSTQGGKSNYIWSVSGVLNTDYKIIDRGTATDNYIVIEWLTIGSKTVSVNYTNPSGCSTSAPGTYTTEIVILDKGQVNGGKHICPGDTMPTLTFNTYANSSIRYPDTSVIVKWQYSDGNNTNYQDIPGTAGLTSYTPSAISGTTRQYRVMVDNGTCTDTSIYSAIDIDVTTAITGQSTAGQSVCSGTAFTPISVTAVGTPRGGQSSVEYQWYINTTNSTTGGTSLVAANGARTNTYTPQAGTAGISYYYYCIVTGNCSTATSAISGAFITNANPTAPTASVTTQPTCSGVKGTITITGVSGLTYSINGTDYYNQTVFGSLDPGTYIVTAKNASGCISQPGTSLQVNIPVFKTWTGATSTVWNLAGNWSPSGIPTATDCVIIPTGVANSPVISDVNLPSYAYTLTVNDKASLTVESATTLRVYGAVKVLSSATTSGTLLFKNSSSLIQTDTDPNINSGNITYLRTTLPIRQADYVYWSTPVKGQTLGGISPATYIDKYLTYNSSQWVAVPRATVMTVGKGYIIRGPEYFSNTARQAYPATFIGTPNNGTLSGETVAASKYYLVGNPYPSALDANKFILDVNNKDILKGTLYFWTHNTPVVLGGAYQYNTDDYASYNVSGGVRTAALSGNASNNNEKPSGQIAAGQSFFVGTKAAGTITFNNTMRSGADNNGQFFKPGKTSKSESFERHRVWLNMTNAGGAFKQLLVGYIDGATNDVEPGFDGATFDGNKYLDFYSISQSSKLVIQGRALPFSDTDTVPLGYKTTIAGDFTIAIDEADGELATQKIYLEDKTTNTIHDLTQSNYTFTTAIGTFTDRFVLRYTNKSLGTGDFENIENGVLISVKDKTVKVLSSKENLKEISIYDISGRILYNKTKVNSTDLQISNLQSSNQVLIVKVTLDNDFTISKKVIFQ
ncbi:T9SS sorting signal type C domain-containing protein [Flavobacterium sp. ASV13]|uniref:T9SS sorting signal type C domain-containing protein n=1 Tax=Flavobacterium sp. ASV13 TaxID=1506583 RepID=UPI00068ED19A|nr:T9SS sorting signal type C domain-containing protein [Flavobacterium sp. ASV13]